MSATTVYTVYVDGQAKANCLSLAAGQQKARALAAQYGRERVRLSVRAVREELAAQPASAYELMPKADRPAAFRATVEQCKNWKRF